MQYKSQYRTKPRRPESRFPQTHETDTNMEEKWFELVPKRTMWKKKSRKNYTLCLCLIGILRKNTNLRLVSENCHRSSRESSSDLVGVRPSEHAYFRSSGGFMYGVLPVFSFASTHPGKLSSGHASGARPVAP
jgi:hypothetical protein